MRSFYGFPISRKSEARDGRTDGRTGATLNAACREGRISKHHFIHTHTFIKEWQHKHAGFKTKHNAQSISQ